MIGVKPLEQWVSVPASHRIRRPSSKFMGASGTPRPSLGGRTGIRGRGSQNHRCHCRRVVPPLSRNISESGHGFAYAWCSRNTLTLALHHPVFKRAVHLEGCAIRLFREAMTSENNEPVTNPFEDPAFRNEQRSLVDEATLNVGRNASLTFGAESLIVLGQSCLGQHYFSKRTIADLEKTKAW